MLGAKREGSGCGGGGGPDWGRQQLTGKEEFVRLSEKDVKEHGSGVQT